ncbi:MAG: recombinase [Sphaerisporangium sp.]|nr:recombinase [Sphaerisporangium sp.]
MTTFQHGREHLLQLQEGDAGAEREIDRLPPCPMVLSADVLTAFSLSLRWGHLQTSPHRAMRTSDSFASHACGTRMSFAWLPRRGKPKRTRRRERASRSAYESWARTAFTGARGPTSSWTRALPATRSKTKSASLTYQAETYPLEVERHPCLRCAAEPGSPCRSRSGAVAGAYHTGRFTSRDRAGEHPRVDARRARHRGTQGQARRSAPGHHRRHAAHRAAAPDER